MKRTALGLAMLAALSAPAVADVLNGYAPVDLTDYMPREGPSALMLLQDLIEGHPQALEGNPAMSIDLKRTEDGNAIRIDVEMTGFLDDSATGEQYRAIVVPAATRGWRLEQLGRKTMCGRGDNAGKWITGSCP